MESLLEHLATLPAHSVYLSVAGILLLCGLGLPIPEDVSLISAGYVAHLGIVNVHAMLAVCLATVLGGDTLAFFLGRWGGRRLLAWKVAERVFSPRKQLRVRAYFRRFGSKVIFVGRFLPGLRFSIFFSAGMMHVRPTAFLLWDGIAALLSVPALVYFAYLFGGQIDHVIAWARRSEWGILALAVLAGSLVALKIWRKRRRRGGRAPAPATPSPRPTATGPDAESA